MTVAAEQIGGWAEEFSGQPATADWIQQLREEAFQRFSEVGFPTTRDEEWRFTNVAPIARAHFPHLDHGGALQALPEAARLHLGKYAPQTNPFVALNTAFLGNVQYFHVRAGTVLEQPVEIHYEAVPDAANHPRTLITIGANAQCTIVETYKGEGRYFTNAVTEIAAAENAVVEHYRVTREASGAYHVAALQASLGRSVNFSSHSIVLGGALVRNDVGATLSEGTEATLNGLYVVNGSEHVDNHTVIDHAKPNAASHELYKGILDGRSSAVFNGRIIVRKDAQKTDSKQTNKNLVLSDESVINTKPELQILADDVRCTHGATIGQLDEEAMFYLRSRGINRQDARSILIYAFAKDILDRVKVAPLRESLERTLFEKLNEHGNHGN